MLKQLELPAEAFSELKKYSDAKGIMFLSTIYDKNGADLLEKMNVPAYKLGSAELTNMPLMEYVARKGKPTIISTGMGNLLDVKKAVDIFKKAGNENIILLHCTTDYPTDFEDVNLLAMLTMKKEFNTLVGYSDHTKGFTVPIMAAAMGASVIEKHFTLSRYMEGPDHSASMEPHELKDMIIHIRNAEKALGTGIKEPTKRERATSFLVKRSIVAASDIPANTVITEDMIAFKRPYGGIEPAALHKVIGKTTKKEIKRNDAIKWEDIM